MTEDQAWAEYCRVIDKHCQQYNDIMQSYPTAEYLDLFELRRVETRADAMKLNAEEIMEICNTLAKKIKRHQSDIRSTKAGAAHYNVAKVEKRIRFLRALRVKVMKGSTVELGEPNGDEDD